MIYEHLTEEDLRKEKWKPVPLEGLSDRYMVSNLGRVKSIGRGHGIRNGAILRPGFRLQEDMTPSYPFVVLGNTTKGIKFRNVDIHRLVCRAYHGEPKAAKLQARHKNDIRYDNRSTNLEWGTATENARDAVRNKRVSTHLDDAVIISVLESVLKGKKEKNIIKKFKIPKYTLRRLLQGNSYQHIDRKALLKKYGKKDFKFNSKTTMGRYIETDPKARKRRDLKILKYVAKGKTRNEAAKRFNVSLSLVSKVIQKDRKQG